MIPGKESKSGYTGVYFHKRSNKWYAQIRNGEKMEYLGTHHDPADAAKAYDKRARELGKMKWLNFPHASDFSWS